MTHLTTTRSGYRMARPGAAALLAVTAWLAAAGTSQADRLVAGGSTLSGKVTSVTSAGVEFQLEFAKDPFLVPWDKIEDISTDATYDVLHGDAGETSAPISAWRDGHVIVGDATIDPKTIVSATAHTSDMPGFRERMRSAMRYWHGSLDIGISLQQATNENFGAYFAVHSLRSKGPTRLILHADYRYATENSEDDDKKLTKDAASGLVRGEYDITKSIYAFGSTDVLYDSIQDLSLRAVPKLGAGYVFWQREPKEKVRDFVQAEAGAGWVYEKYMSSPDDPDGSDDSYFTIALGAAAAILLPREIAVDWRFDYLPNVTDWSDYVIRTGAGLSAIVIAPLSLRIAITDVYDSTPPDDVKSNSLNLDTTLSVVW